MQKNGRGKRVVSSPVLKNFIVILCAFAVFSLAWILAYALVENPYLLPSFSSSVKTAFSLLSDDGFLRAFLSTLLRVEKAFALSFLLAFVFAFLSFFVKAVERFSALFVATLRSLPTLAVLLIILVWTSPTEAPVVVAFLALYPMLYTAILSALKGVDGKLTDACKIFRVPLYKRIVCLYLPSCAPQVIREGAGALSFTIKLVVSAEVVANTYKSVGGLMQESKIYLEIPKLFALTLLVILTGLLLETFGRVLSDIVERRTK